MLKSTIKSLIQKNGIQYIYEHQFINVLSDLQAFVDNPATKFVLKTVIQEGFAKNLQSHSQNESDTTIFAERLMEELYTKFGFRKDISIIVLNALLYALGHKELPCKRQCVDNGVFIAPCEDSHIKFSGISLSHSLEEIENHLLKRGFKTVKASPYQISMMGTFCGINNVALYINGSPLGVTTAIVLRIQNEATCLYISWGKKLYDLLLNKYGKPTRFVDQLLTIQNDFDYYCKNILRYTEMIDKYNTLYQYEWDVIGGTIELCWVGNVLILQYTDTLNVNAAHLHQQQFDLDCI